MPISTVTDGGDSKDSREVINVSTPGSAGTKAEMLKHEEMKLWRRCCGCGIYHGNCLESAAMLMIMELG